MSEPAQSELDLRVFLDIVRRRLWVIVLVPLLVAGAAFAAASARTPLYRASAEILIGRNDAETILNEQGSTSADPNRVLANQIRIIGSQAITDKAAARLGFPAKINASASKTEDVITISAVDEDPARAAQVVNAYSQTYLDYRQASRSAQNAAVQAQLRRQIDPGEARLKQLDDELRQAPADRREAVVGSQTAERELILSTIGPLRTQLARLESANNVEQGGAQLLRAAQAPRSPFEPKPLRSLVLGLVMGLLIAVAVALLLDYLDNRIRTKEDLERAGPGLPVLGLIPTAEQWREAREAHIVSLEDAPSPAAEAYRSLRTAVVFVGLDREIRSLQVTSPAISEGKTTTLVNLAVALARAGQRVVAVDCDLRRPRLHEFFGMAPGPGFTSVLMGDLPLSQAVRPVDGLPRLLVLQSGPVPPNPSEILTGSRSAQILDSLTKQADIVLIDSPPVLPVSDSVVLATQVDATLLVATAHRTQRKQVSRSVELLRQVDAGLVGTVLNRTDVTAQYGAYTYGYTREATIGQVEAGDLAGGGGNGAQPSGNGHNGTKPVPAPTASGRRRR